MIIGRGDVAKETPDKIGYIFYANGCSNRLPLSIDLCEKEIEEIRAIDSTEKMFVYFSTLSIYYSNSEYTRHKVQAEKIVQMYHENYCIMRLGNINWGNNPKTLLNYLKRDQKEIKNTYRYILNKEEFRHWVGMIPTLGQHQMNVTGKLTWVPDLIKQINEGKIYTDK